MYVLDRALVLRFFVKNGNEVTFPCYAALTIIFFRLGARNFEILTKQEEQRDGSAKTCLEKLLSCYITGWKSIERNSFNVQLFHCSLTFAQKLHTLFFEIFKGFLDILFVAPVLLATLFYVFVSQDLFANRTVEQLSRSFFCSFSSAFRDCLHWTKNNLQRYLQNHLCGIN